MFLEWSNFQSTSPPLISKTKTVKFLSTFCHILHTNHSSNKHKLYKEDVPQSTFICFYYVSASLDTEDGGKVMNSARACFWALALLCWWPWSLTGSDPEITVPVHKFRNRKVGRGLSPTRVKSWAQKLNHVSRSQNSNQICGAHELNHYPVRLHLSSMRSLPLKYES